MSEMRRIKITYDGKKPMGYNARVVDAETGQDIQWVRRVEVVLDAGGVVEAVLYISGPELEIEADAETRPFSMRTEDIVQEERIARTVAHRVEDVLRRLLKR